MHYSIKQKIMAFGKQYRVMDESGREVYEIRSMLFSPERRKEVYDMNESLIAWSEWPVLSEQAVIEGRGSGCTLQIPLMSLTPQWEGTCGLGSISVSGDFLRLSFTVSTDRGVVATIEKRFFAFSDTYEVDISGEGMVAEYVLLIASMIDHKYHSDKGS